MPDRQPLHSLAVLVTRPAGQAKSLCRRLHVLGAEVYRLPTLAIAPSPLDGALRQSLHRAAAADWLVFVSRNAVEVGLDAMHRAGLSPHPSCRLAAVGPATADALESRGLRVHLCPQEGFNSEALLAEPEWDVRGRRVAIMRGAGGRGLLGESLRGRGALVEYIEVYRRALPKIDADPILAAWLSRPAPVAVLTSGDGSANLMRLAPHRHREALRNAALVCISARVAGNAAAFGFRGERVVAPTPGDDGVIDALRSIAANNENRSSHDGTDR